MSGKSAELLVQMKEATSFEGDPESSHSQADRVLIAAVRFAGGQLADAELLELADLWEERAPAWWWA